MFSDTIKAKEMFVISTHSWFFKDVVADRTVQILPFTEHGFTFHYVVGTEYEFMFSIKFILHFAANKSPRRARRFETVPRSLWFDFAITNLYYSKYLEREVI